MKLLDRIVNKIVKKKLGNGVDISIKDAHLSKGKMHMRIDADIDAEGCRRMLKCK